MDEDNCHAPVIILWTSCPPHHLKHICDWVVNVTTCFAIIILCSLDDHEVCWEVHTPSQSAGCYENLQTQYIHAMCSYHGDDLCTHLYLLIDKQLLNSSPVLFMEASMMDANTK